VTRALALLASLALVVSCDHQTPSAPAPPPVPTGPNQAPQVVASVSPQSGIDGWTTYTVEVRVTDPDSDPVALLYRRCNIVPEDTPLQLNNGVGRLSFKADSRCGALVTLTGVDARGASTRIFASAEHMGLGGSFRLVIGEGVYTQPHFYITLTQSDASVTGTIRDGDKQGAIDAAEPGHIEEDGQFRLRFKIPSEPADLILSGRVMRPLGGPFGDTMIASGHVVGGRYTGRVFQIWQLAQY
jgi:hypothetical protein